MPLRLVLVLALTLVSACGTDERAPDPIATEPVSPPPSEIAYDLLVVEGEDAQPNIFDPSLEYAQDASTGWLAYTDVEGGAAPIGPLHHSNIARSDDGGETWTLVTRANLSERATLIDNHGVAQTGAWAYEVPSLVHVPDDQEAPWKLFTHRYFWTEAERLAAYGWIALREAASPSGPWGEEVALFGTNFTPFEPFETRLNIADLDASLSDAVALTEPGTLYRNGVLYLSLSVLLPDGPDRIILLVSVDQGETWRFLATLITRADAQAIGAARYDGSSLTQVGEEVYLLATPERNGFIHDGTHVFRFADIETGRLERSGARLAVINHIPLQTDETMGDNRGGGQVDYDEANRVGGVLFPQIDTDNAPGPIAQIYKTRKSPID
ncbi:MAG: hypothetical protein AAGH57_13850 [Pseudomonadota bacterium]